MSTSPSLMRLERYFLSFFPQCFALTFSLGGIEGEGNGVAVVCAVAVAVVVVVVVAVVCQGII